MPDEPSTWELARSLKEIKDTLQGVMTVALWQAYQTGLDQRLADLTRELNASTIRHNTEIDRLERALEKHAETSAADKKALETRQASQRFALILGAVALLGTFVLQFVQIGGAS